MDAKDQSHHPPQFWVLSEEQIERIYQATLECLQRTGVNVPHAEARELLVRAGAQADGIRVRIPPQIIQECVAATPGSFHLYGRDGSRRLEIGAGKVYFGPGPTCTYFIDPETGERRKTRRGDPGLAALVCDALENIDYVMGLGLIDDVTPALAPVYEFAEMITNTVKPVLPWAYSVENVKDIYKIALAVAGSEEALRQHPFLALFATFQSPLVHTDHELTNVLWAAERGLPIVYLGGGSSGSTAPVTGAGALVITLAGALSGLAIIQLKKRGAAVCIGGVPQSMDLRTSRPSYGGPEMSLYSAALAEVSRYLGLPFMGTAGASESKMLELQAAIESTIQVVFSGLSGAPLVHDVGFLDCADIGSLEMLAMNDEIIAMVRRILRGMEVSTDTLMLDLIDRVGPGGEFMSTKETAKRCRAEIWMPEMMDRRPWVTWEEAGAPVMADLVRARVGEILRRHQPAPLSQRALEQIEAILQAAEAGEASDSSEKRP
jgi:trimethylamine--corrinoid protein Co-methyltransferase